MIPQLITGGTQLLSQVGNMWQAKKQRIFQREMAQTAYNRDMEMWNKSNAYNSPQAQMQRLKDAGLNPNMMYGNGSASTGNTSTSMPKYQNYETPVANIALPNLLEMLGQFQDIKGKTLSNDAQVITNQYLQTQRDLQTKMLDTAWRKGRMDLGDRTLNVTTDNNPYLTKTQEQAKQSEMDTVLKKVQVDFYKKIPKQYQWLAPLFMQLMRK